MEEKGSGPGTTVVNIGVVYLIAFFFFLILRLVSLFTVPFSVTLTHAKMSVRKHLTHSHPHHGRPVMPDPMVPQYGPLIVNPYKTNITPV